MVLMIGAFSALLATRSVVEVALDRDRNVLFSEALNGDVVNDFQLSILNKQPIPVTYELALSGRPGARLVAPETIQVAVGERVTVGIQIELAPQKVVQARLPFTLEVSGLGSSDVKTDIQSTFIGPSQW